MASLKILGRMKASDVGDFYGGKLDLERELEVAEESRVAWNELQDSLRRQTFQQEEGMMLQPSHTARPKSVQDNSHRKQRTARKKHGQKSVGEQKAPQINNKKASITGNNSIAQRINQH